MKRLIASPLFRLGAVLYLTIWLLTFAVGGRQVKRFTLAYLEVPPGVREVPVDTEYLAPLPVYGCQVVSYAPFFVTSRYMFWWDDEAALGGTAIHFWFGVPSPPFRLHDWRS